MRTVKPLKLTPATKVVCATGCRKEVSCASVSPFFSLFAAASTTNAARGLARQRELAGLGCRLVPAMLLPAQPSMRAMAP